MHNSRNYASSKASFTSAVLAQATLLDIPTLFKDVTSLDTQSVYNNIVCKIDLLMQGQEIEFTTSLSLDTNEV